MPLPSLQNEIEKKEFLLAVIAQINKDFCKAGLDVEIPAQTKAEVVSEFLSKMLEQIFRTSQSNKIQQLLYCVDVSEETISDLMKENPKTEYSTLLSFAVLRREIQKVYYKDSF